MTITRYQDQSVPPSKFAVIRWFGLDQFIPERAVTSHWVSPKIFFAIRFIITLYSTIVWWSYLAVEIYWWHAGSTVFEAFTTLTFVGLHSYLVTSCVYHARYLYHNKNVDFLLNQPAILNYLYMYLYSTVCTFNILTPVVFWSILSPGDYADTLVNWLNISVHGISFFLMIFDVIFNRLTLPVRLILFPFFTMLLYMVMSFIIYSTTDHWVYPFLSWSQGPSAAIWYFMVAIITIVAYFVVMLITFIRDWIACKTGRAETCITAVVDEKTEEERAGQQRHPIEIDQDSQMTQDETNRSSIRCNNNSVV